MRLRKADIIFLLLISAASIALAYPTVGQNIDSPNRIVYFNADEGYLMDLGWFYHSGDKRPSYHMSLDYGLELVYLTDITRLILSNFVRVTPITIVLIVRWLHLISWVAALIALWFMVKRHFGGYWKPALAVSLLAVRPAFDHCLNTLKPEPVVLLFMILGLNYVLRMVEDPYDKKNITIAAAFASLAMIVKFAGIFLLPAMVAALYFGRSHIDVRSVKQELLAKISWIFSTALSVLLITAPFIMMVFYIRKATGLTPYREFGLTGSILKYKIVLVFWFAGVLLAFLTAALFYLRIHGNKFFKKLIYRIDNIAYYTAIATGSFILFIAIFGLRWLAIPQHFMQVYGATSMDFTGGYNPAVSNNAADVLWAWFQTVSTKVRAFDPAIMMLTFIYIVMELKRRLGHGIDDKIGYYKRIVLVIFLLPCLYAVFFSSGTFSSHHMLPFFTAAVILSLEGLSLSRRSFSGYRRSIVTGFFILVLLFDIQASGTELINKRIYSFNKDKDIAFEIARWWHSNIPVDARIVADHYRFIYIPDEYTQVKTFIRYEEDAVEQFRRLVDTYKPKYIYVREGDPDFMAFPNIEKILPEGKVKVLKIFDDTGLPYQRCPNSRFIIYEVLK